MSWETLGGSRAGLAGQRRRAGRADCPRPRIPVARLALLLDVLEGTTVGQGAAAQERHEDTAVGVHGVPGAPAPVGIGGIEADAGQIDPEPCAVGPSELVEDSDYRLFRRDRRPVEGDGDVEGVDDGMAEGAGCAAAGRLPFVQQLGAQCVQLGSGAGLRPRSSLTALRLERAVDSPDQSVRLGGRRTLSRKNPGVDVTLLFAPSGGRKRHA